VVLAGRLRSGLGTGSQPAGPSEPQDVGIGLRRQLLGGGIIGDAQGTLRSVLHSDDQSVMDQLVEDGGERGGRKARCNCKRRTPIIRRPTAEVRVAGGERRCSRRPCRTAGGDVEDGQPQPLAAGATPEAAPGCAARGRLWAPARRPASTTSCRRTAAPARGSSRSHSSAPGWCPRRDAAAQPVVPLDRGGTHPPGRRR